jgi:alkanesulfonate monooxygenase SsuD/methylene tetrahydromethanopterin reductase-like flavin-dependent oxidoreductase (luciferase family)
MKNLIVGVHVAGVNAPKLVDGIVAAERAGVQCAWMTCGAVAPDPLVVFAAAAARTTRIMFGTSIIPTFPRHPLALVQGATAVDALAPGRLRLGVGPSHKPSMEGTWGIPFERPQEHLREYLTVLKAALNDGKVDFDGKRIKAHAQLPGPTRVTVMASALRAIGFHTCGELADAPPLVAHVPVVVSEDVGGIRKGATEQLGRYPRVPYYSRMFQDAGFPEAKDGQLSDRMIDALVVHGSAAQVKERLRQLPSFGADELLAMPILPPGDAHALERTLAALGELAAE